MNREEVNNEIWPGYQYEDKNVQVKVVIPAERRSEIRSSQVRVLSAINFFENNFDKDGLPKTSRGELLTQKYQEVTLYNIKKIRSNIV